MKKNFALILSVLMMFSLASCGSKKDDKPDKGSGDSQIVEDKKDDKDGKENKKEARTYSSGVLSVEVPDGWNAGTWYSIHPEEKSEDETDQQIDKEDVIVYKGEDYDSSPFVEIMVFLKEDNFYNIPESGEDFGLTDAEELPDMKIGNETYGVFKDKYSWGLYTKKDPTEDNYMITVFSEGSDGSKIDINDKDVQQIISSVKKDL